MVWRSAIRRGYPYRKDYGKKSYKYNKWNERNINTLIAIKHVEILREFNDGNYKLAVGVIYFHIPRNFSLPSGVYDPIIVEAKEGVLWVREAKLAKITLEIKEENLQDIYELVKFLAQKASGSNESKQVELTKLMKEADKVGIAYKVFDKIIEKLENKDYIEIMEGDKGDKKVKIVVFKK